MAVKFENPPVVYAVAKLIYNESIGTYGDSKYKLLIDSFRDIGLDSYVLSKLTGIQFKQSDNKFSASPASSDRVGYYSPNRKSCAVLDENTIELRIAEYTNHTHFLDTFKKVIQIFNDNDIAVANTPHEIELNYVDIFAPEHGELNSMFNNIKMPISQFHSEDNDFIKFGIIQFSRILECRTKKVSVNLEQHIIKESNTAKKIIPDALREADKNLAMHVDAERLFKNKNILDYAIVHTSCAALITEEDIGLDSIREKFEDLYVESRKTFDAMINKGNCDKIWNAIN